jgi:predicted DNA-binding protein YlxM (UPF0122 family)
LSRIDLDDLVSQSEAARLRGISRQAISDLVSRGRLTVYEISDKKFLSKKEVLAYEDGRTIKGKELSAKKQK